MTSRTLHVFRRLLWLGLTAFIVLFSSPVAPAAPLYSITDLGTLPGKTSSVATAINNQGQVVGISYNSSDGSFVQNFSGSAEPPRFQQTGNGGQSFLYSNGQMTSINPIGGLALSINDSGQAVGGQFTSTNASGQYVGGPGAGILTDNYYTGNPPQAELVSGGRATPLGLVPYAINNQGQIVGTIGVSSPGLGTDPALYQGGKVTDLSAMVGGYTGNSRAIAINQKGDILVNFVDVGPKTISLLYSTATGRVMANLSALPGDSGMIGAALNNKDQVVGNGFLYGNGTIQTLASLVSGSSGWSNLNATGINDSGQIVGQGLINGQEHAFLMTDPDPSQVPEPGTLGVWGLIFVAAASRLIRRRQGEG